MDVVTWWLLLNLWWIIAGAILLAVAFLGVTLVRNRLRSRREPSSRSE